jgi:polyketide synthase Type III
VAASLSAGPTITGVGTGVPPDSYTQQEILDELAITDPRIRSLFMNSAIERRNLSLPPRAPDGNRVAEPQGALLRKHVRVGLQMGRAAIEACVAQAGATVSDIEYLCCVSSTGFVTPGLSALLIRELSLRRECERLDVVGMGCNAGLNGLNATAGWTRSRPGALAVMACIETCSAAYVFDGTMRTSVVNSLFGDGAAAVAVVGEPAGDRGARSEPCGPTILRFASRIIPEAIDAMRYDWDDNADRFSFYIDPDVPYVVGAHAAPAVARLLDGTGLRLADIDHWIVHSGGKKVVDSVRVNLGLSRHDVRHTTGVLRDHGNLSSGSFLFSLRRLIDEECVRPGDVGVLMTMGPGSTIELALVRW